MIITEYELNDFARLCNETKRASFSITRNVKTNLWHVRVGGKSFKNRELSLAVILATQFIEDNKEKTNGHIQLKDYAYKIK